jgi:hypothetical protein
MKITNKNNLPSAFVNLANEKRVYKEKRYSVTTILAGAKEILLKKKYDDVLEQDVEDMIAMLFGTAMHTVLENADKTNMKEIRLEEEIIDGYFLTGQFDLYNKKDHAIEDYKTGTVWKIKKGDFEDWRKQGLQYAWLCRKNNIVVEQLKFHVLIKDWSKLKAKYDSTYPQHPIWTWQYKISSRDMLEIEDFIFTKFKELIYFEGKEFIPHCTDRERWSKGSKFAVMKNGKKRALKIFDTRKNAIANNTGDYIEERKGEDVKCDNYCLANKYCDYYKKSKEVL